MQIKSLTPLRPDARKVRSIVSQPFDVVDTEEARLRLRDDHLSFLHVVRSEIDFPDGTDPSSEPVLQRARENLEQMVSEGLYILDEEPAYYLYRLNRDGHQQTGVALRVSVDDYLENRIRRHEHIRPGRVNTRALHIDRVGANTGPVFLMYDAGPVRRMVEDLDQIADRRTPIYDVSMPNGIRHRLYRIPDPDFVHYIDECFIGIQNLYIADGHHRAASAVEASLLRRERNPDYSSQDAMNYFLAVCFPDDQLRILPIHRVLTHLNGYSPKEILEKILTRFPLFEESNAPLSPAQGEIIFVLGDRYYRLGLRQFAKAFPCNDPVSCLDVSILHRELIAPIFGISDPTVSEAIHFVGGLSGEKDAIEMVRSGRNAAAFLLHAVAPEDVRRVADANQTLPPKATWFDPKMRSGFLVNPLDESYSLLATNAIGCSR